MPEPLKAVPLIVELSRYNKFCNLEAAKLGGVEEVFIAMGIGMLADPYAALHWQMARELELRRSCYWAFDPRQDPRHQADAWRAMLMTVDYDERVDEAYGDFEIAGVMTQATRAERTYRFLETIRLEAASNVGIYTRASWWDPMIGAQRQWPAEFPLNVAHYNVLILQPALPRAWKVKGWRLWQYVCQRSTIPGITGEITLLRRSA